MSARGPRAARIPLGAIESKGRLDTEKTAMQASCDIDECEKQGKGARARAGVRGAARLQRHRAWAT